MKTILLLLCFGNFMYAQTVTTFFSDDNFDVDDAMAFDVDGNLYGSNFDGSTVYKITPDGVGTPFIENLANPNGMAFDSNGDFYLCEYSAGMINKYAADGTFIEMFDIQGTPSGLIKDFDSDSMIYTDVSNNSVNRLDPDGTITELIQGNPLNAPVGLTFDDAGTLYIGNFVGRQVYRLTNALEYVATVPDNGATGGFDALGFIVWANELIYGTNFGGNQVYRINPDAVDDVALLVGSVAGDTDGTLDIATLNTPNGIIYNASEDALYVSEYSGMGNIRVINDFILNTDEFDLGTTLDIYPNPVSDIVHIKAHDQSMLDDIVLRLYDMQGRVLETLDLSEQTISNEFEWNVSTLSTGTYFLKFTTSEGVSHSEKLLKK